ncbi:hypothetical protein D9M73_100330 [compost metagenome]
MAGLFGAFTRRAYDGDQAQGRVLLVQGLPAQAELEQGRRAKGRDQHIGPGQFTVQGFLALVRLEVGRRDANPLVHGHIGGGVVQAHGIAGCARG